MVTPPLWRVSMAGIIAGALILSLSFVPASATSRNHASPMSAVVVGHPSHGPLRPGAGVPGATLPLLAGTHYVYADDGLYTNNTIDEFSATASGLTHLGTVLTGSFATTLAYGQNDIAVHGNCLVHSDSGGSIQSYAIDSSTGLLTQVSTLAVNTGLGSPGDTKISRNGQDAYVASYNFYGGGQLISIPLSSTCVFGTAAYFAVPSSDLYFSIVQVDATHLLAVNYYANANDIYTITGGTALTLERSNPSTISNPDGAATGTVSGQTYTFNGQAVYGPPQAEADTYSAATGMLAPAPGSPQTDGDASGNNGPNVYYAQAYNLLTQANSGFMSIAAYSIQGQRI